MDKNYNTPSQAFSDAKIEVTTSIKAEKHLIEDVLQEASNLLDRLNSVGNALENSRTRLKGYYGSDAAVDESKSSPEGTINQLSETLIDLHATCSRLEKLQHFFDSI